MSNYISWLTLFSVPGVPELRLYSARVDAVSFSWVMPRGSLVHGYEVTWNIDHDQFASFRDFLSRKANNYTVTGLRGFGNATYSIFVTAHNSVGSATSTSMNLAAYLAVVDSGSPNQVSSSSDDNNAEIIGAVVAGFVILAVVVVAILVYRYKSKSKKPLDRPVYT